MRAEKVGRRAGRRKLVRTRKSSERFEAVRGATIDSRITFCVNFPLLQPSPVNDGIRGRGIWENRKKSGHTDIWRVV